MCQSCSSLLVELHGCLHLHTYIAYIYIAHMALRHNLIKPLISGGRSKQGKNGCYHQIAAEEQERAQQPNSADDRADQDDCQPTSDMPPTFHQRETGCSRPSLRVLCGPPV